MRYTDSSNPVKRRLLNLLTVLSLLICVAVMALWVRSLWIGDMVTWLACRDGTRITFASVDAHAGAVVLAATTWTLPADAPAPSVQGLSEFSSRESRSYQAPVSTFREQN